MLLTAIIYLAAIATMVISVTILMMIVKAYFVALKWLVNGKSRKV